ncbi:MAG: hypothetical protein QM682_14505 [Paracoccus sp. (in: a-proteobacteria)]|uniref:hypothetical protein n=1 Tax=Paracoccus sp. TaxID=267 RepID=UPI0039E65530
MSQNVTGDAARPAGLARNSIGTTHIVFFVVAAAAPLASVVGVSPAASMPSSPPAWAARPGSPPPRSRF